MMKKLGKERKEKKKDFMCVFQVTQKRRKENGRRDEKR